MISKQEAWNLFESSGNVYAYLLYRELCELETRKREEQVIFDAQQDQGDCHQGNAVF